MKEEGLLLQKSCFSNLKVQAILLKLVVLRIELFAVLYLQHLMTKFTLQQV